MALHMNGKWHAQFFMKNADWHLNVQYLCFVKLQGHYQVQRKRYWAIFIEHDCRGNISCDRMCVLCVHLDKSLQRITTRTETRATADKKNGHDVNFWQEKKNLVLETRMFLFEMSKIKQRMIVCVYRAVPQSHDQHQLYEGRQIKNTLLNVTHLQTWFVNHDNLKKKKVHRYTDCS